MNHPPAETYDVWVQDESLIGQMILVVFVVHKSKALLSAIVRTVKQNKNYPKYSSLVYISGLHYLLHYKSTDYSFLLISPNAQHAL